jgi:putative CocE/NonD family hydrolase
MTLSDGTVLLAKRWFPEGHDGGLPTLLMRTPYGRTAITAVEAALYAERGYNVVAQSVRGTHGSGGTFEAFMYEAADGAETLRWVHQQPWCDGRVSTVGGSYVGYTQLAAAAAAEPGLITAMAPAMTSADLRCLLKPYGVFALDGAGRWIHGLDPQGRRGAFASLRHGLTSNGPRTRAANQLPLRETDLILYGEALPFYRSWVDSPPDSPYWTALDAREGHLVQDAPICLHAGWFDIFGQGQLADAAELLATGRDVRLVVGPWSHTGGSGAKLRDAIRFLDETVQGRTTSTDPRPVRVQLYGDKRWWALPTWPPPSEPHRWYLTTDGRLDASPPTASGRIEWTDDPSDPAPSCGGATLMKGGPADNRKREARDDVVTFTSEPLSEDLVILGTPRVTARASADTPSFDVVVRLCVVDEKDVSRNISDGLHRVEGKEADIDIEMWPTGVRVRRGQRLRIQVAGALHPLWARNLHTGEDPAKGTTAIVAHQCLVIGPDSPAIVELPVVHFAAEDLARN